MKRPPAGERAAGWAALKQADPERAFQRIHPPGDGGVVNPQMARGPEKLAGPRHGEKDTDIVPSPLDVQIRTTVPQFSSLLCAFASLMRQTTRKGVAMLDRLPIRSFRRPCWVPPRKRLRLPLSRAVAWGRWPVPGFPRPR